MKKLFPMVYKSLMIILSLALLIFFTADISSNASDEKFYPLELPLISEDRNLGTINVQVSIDGKVMIESDGLVRVIDDILSESVSAK